MKPLQTPGTIGSVLEQAVAGPGVSVPKRVCALRRTEDAVRLAYAKISRDASRMGR